jgi:hypothetical protein
MTWTVFVGTVSHRRPGPNRTLAPASAARRELLLPIEPEKLRVVDDVAFPLEQNMPEFAAQIGDRNAGLSGWASCSGPRRGPEHPRGGNVTVCRNGGLSQTDYTSKEFSENRDSNLSFTKTKGLIHRSQKLQEQSAELLNL